MKKGIIVVIFVAAAAAILYILFKPSTTVPAATLGGTPAASGLGLGQQPLTIQAQPSSGLLGFLFGGSKTTPGVASPGVQATPAPSAAQIPSVVNAAQYVQNPGIGNTVLPLDTSAVNDVPLAQPPSLITSDVLSYDSSYVDNSDYGNDVVTD